ncbi:MAG: hypothetical protein QOF78_2137 [Phycisphaerales bacterium]|nr:hypothetical protein [Phycisphaerales bacterium]
MAENGPTDELLRRLLAAVAAQASDPQHIEQLIADARAEAEREIAALVKSAYKALLLRGATEQLEAITNIASTPPAPKPQADVHRSRADAEPAACYIYAITPAAPPNWTATVTSIDPHRPLEIVMHEDVQAIVSPVSLEEFGQAALDERVTDPQWVEEKVRAHDHVIQSAMSAGAVIPCRFCTVVRSVDDVRALLAANHGGIAQTLATLRGKQEWGVKIHADVAALARQLIARGGGEPDTPDAGKRYLERKKREDDTRGDAERFAREQAEECHVVLAAAAADAAMLPRRPRAGAAGRDAEPVLNAAYLLADEDVERFHDAVAALAERYRPLGLEFDMTGPWPPYNFVRLDLSLQAVA